MATVLELCESLRLREISPELEPQELVHRCLYGTPDFVTWLENELPGYASDPVNIDMSPLEQVAVVFHAYVVGLPFSTDRRFKKLSWTPQHHIWEIKTDDIRIFGWIPRRDAFICCFGDLKSEIEIFRKYGLYIARTKYVRENMNLDEPKCVEGKDYNDVISN